MKYYCCVVDLNDTVRESMDTDLIQSAMAWCNEQSVSNAKAAKIYICNAETMKRVNFFDILKLV